MKKKKEISLEDKTAWQNYIKDPKDVVDKELTTQMAQNHQARKILAQTDWYVIRKMETGKEIPDNIISLRMQARSNVVNE